MAAAQLPKLKEVLATVHRSRILELRLNTPENLNCFTPRKSRDLVAGLEFAKESPDIDAVVVTAQGRIFSSGAPVQGEHKISQDSDMLRGAKEFVSALIDFPKLLATAIHGHAFGIAVTMLPLFDLVYAAPNATFTAPFSRIGISAEGCSSTTFPPLFGPTMTARLLYLAQTVPASELQYSGLFRELLPAEGMQEIVVQKVDEQLAGLAPGSIVASKGLVRSPEIRAALQALNDKEMGLVNERLGTQEHRDALARFLESQQKKKNK